MIMKGLFSYNYDRYEWEYLICVSESEEKLVGRYHNLNNAGHQLVMHYQEDLHYDLACQEVPHLMIKEVEVL